MTSQVLFSATLLPWIVKVPTLLPAAGITLTYQAGPNPPAVMVLAKVCVTVELAPVLDTVAHSIKVLEKQLL